MSVICKIEFENFSANVSVNPEMIFRVAVNEWFRRGGDAEFLENHQLNENSIVVEVGGYKGAWSKKMADRYNPNLFILEPISRFRKELQHHFCETGKVKILDYGLGKPGIYEVSVKTDETSIFSQKADNSENILVKTFNDFARENKISQIDLLQINIEGSEYDLLCEMLANSAMSMIKKIQVQFHLNVGDAVARRDAIREKMRITHKEVFNFPFVWEAWERN